MVRLVIAFFITSFFISIQSPLLLGQDETIKSFADDQDKKCNAIMNIMCNSSEIYQDISSDYSGLDKVGKSVHIISKTSFILRLLDNNMLLRMDLQDDQGTRTTVSAKNIHYGFYIDSKDTTNFKLIEIDDPVRVPDNSLYMKPTAESIRKYICKNYMIGGSFLGELIEREDLILTLNTNVSPWSLNILSKNLKNLQSMHGKIIEGNVLIDSDTKEIRSGQIVTVAQGKPYTMNFNNVSKKHGLLYLLERMDLKVYSTPDITVIPLNNTITTYRYNVTVRSDAEFRLSYYGLPEPEGISWDRPTPNYIWLLAGCGVFGLLAVLCSYLRRRNSRTSITKESAS